MTNERPASIAAHFGHVTDPRIERSREHSLLDILTIAICAVVCGAEGPTGMEEFGQGKEAWLRQYLELPNGIPSHDTFGRVLARLDPEELHQGFVSWFAAIREATNGEVVALDGKTLRGSADRTECDQNVWKVHGAHFQAESEQLVCLNFTRISF